MRVQDFKIRDIYIDPSEWIIFYKRMPEGVDGGVTPFWEGVDVLDPFYCSLYI